MKKSPFKKPLRSLFLISLLSSSLLHAQSSVRTPQGSDLIFRDSFNAPNWVSYTGPNFWSCSANCSLVGGQFVEAGAGMTLVVNGTWAAGLRPTAVRVNASAYGNGQLFQLGVGLFGGGIDFGSCSNYVLNSACNLNVTSDIQRINLYLSERVNSIEFLLP